MLPYPCFNTGLVMPVFQDPVVLCFHQVFSRTGKIGNGIQGPAGMAQGTWMGQKQENDGMVFIAYAVVFVLKEPPAVLPAGTELASVTLSQFDIVLQHLVI